MNHASLDRVSWNSTTSNYYTEAKQKCSICLFRYFCYVHGSNHKWQIFVEQMSRFFFPLKLKNLEQIKLAFCYKFSKNKDYLRMINQYKLYNLINVSNQIICFFHRNLISTRKKLVHWNYWIMQYLMPVIVKWRRKMRMEGHVRRYYLCYPLLYKLS